MILPAAYGALVDMFRIGSYLGLEAVAPQNRVNNLVKFDAIMAVSIGGSPNTDGWDTIEDHDHV